MHSFFIVLVMSVPPSAVHSSEQASVCDFNLTMMKIPLYSQIMHDIMALLVLANISIICLIYTGG